MTSLVDSGNLTISGTLQSPLTSLIGVSISTIDARTISTIGVSGSQYLTRNETILPSTFTGSSLTGFGSISNLNFSNTTGNRINLFNSGT